MTHLMPGSLLAHWRVAGWKYLSWREILSPRPGILHSCAGWDLWCNSHNLHFLSDHWSCLKVVYTEKYIRVVQARIVSDSGCVWW